ncbi:MAG: A/G-specific adenine glycosylase [Opitutales bacterium]|nr:A/G-specific adenine glycosylase [Opitutales bacterium]
MASFLHLSEEATRKAFRTALREWFAREQRDLPWRRERTVYRTVVSEFMLQQTRVASMLPSYARWMEAFPDFSALAKAPEEVVMKHWEGLGYYNRARNLHRLSKILATHRGPFPKDLDFWLALPGIGPYTASAISSIALGGVATCVDGNVVRILARLDAEEKTFTNSGEAVQFFRQAAEELLDKEHPGVYNEALMELGATVCHRRKPACMLCPVRAFCRSGLEGKAEGIPAIGRKKTVRLEHRLAWWVVEGKVLLRGPGEGRSRLGTLYEIPRWEEIFAEPPPTEGKAPRQVRHITHHHITEYLYQPGAEKKLSDNLGPEFRWVPLSALPELPFSGPHRRWVERCL